MASWIATGHRASAGFHPNACRVLSPGVALCAGWCEPYAQPQAVILEVRPAGLRELVRQPGRCLALDLVGNSLWALLAKARTSGEGSDFHVAVSNDGGESWMEGPAVPADSLSRLCAVSATQAWVLGSETLLRTLDCGQTWQAVEAPGSRSGVTERLVATGSTVRILTQNCILSLRAGASAWEALDLQGARACALDVGGLLAVRDQQIKFGAPHDGQVAWLGSFDYDAEPVGLAVSEHGARFVALPNHPEQYAGIFYFESQDQGAHWNIQLIPGRVIEGAVDLRREGGIMVGPEGDLFVLQD